MNTDLTSDFRYVVGRHGFPPIRVSYSRVAQIMREFEEYSGYWKDPEFGAGWKFHAEALDFDDNYTGAYAEVTSGISTSLVGAYQSAKGCFPKEAWPFISHQMFGRRETFNFALEYELVTGPDALHQEAESGWLEKFKFHAESLDGDPERNWATDDD